MKQDDLQTKGQVNISKRDPAGNQKELDDQLAQLSFNVKSQIYQDDFIINQARKAQVLHAEKARRRLVAKEAKLDEEDLEEHNDEEFDESTDKTATIDDWWIEYLKEKEGKSFSMGDRINKINRLAEDIAVRAESGDEYETEIDTPYEPAGGFVINEVIQLGYHTKLTVGGRINSHSALVLIGTGKGTAGFGYGKGASAGDATERAFKDAERNLVSVALYHGGLPNSVLCKCRRSFVKFTAYSHRTRSGAANHPVMQTIANAFGIKNVNIRSYKRRTWHNMLEAIMKTIPRTIHPEEMARRQGKKYKDADILGNRPIRPKLL